MYQILLRHQGYKGEHDSLCLCGAYKYENTIIKIMMSGIRKKLGRFLWMG